MFKEEITTIQNIEFSNCTDSFQFSQTQVDTGEPQKNKIARHLLEIGAIFLRPNDPFTWVSGIVSPIYCDNRLTLSYPEVRREIEQGLAEIIRSHFPTCQAVYGTSTAGIPHASLTADILNLPMGYVRAGAKDHGRNNQIEGRIEPGWDVVVIEDLISTASSAIQVVEILRDAGCNVLGIVSIFTYGMNKGLENLREANVINISLSDFDTLIETALEKRIIELSDVKKLLAFRANPSDNIWQSL
ncbi:MAG: orotate phosphoribosyltransferase [Flexilinea flocculi]|jgi:orotate phosphoribosyltransferase|nr:orotate phosphoribosyltransferase [Flexilinea flocculi]